jgi:C4-dicarboxylate-specific signal transduction histidine kinase
MYATAYEITHLHGIPAPAESGDHRSFEIAGRTLDVLVDILRLDFACVRYYQVVTDTPIDLIRLPQHLSSSERVREVGRAFSRWLAARRPQWPVPLPDQAQEGEIRIAHLPLGLQDEIGILVVGARRMDFPTSIEMLIFRFATNQAALAAHEVWRSKELRRPADELEQRGVKRAEQRTAHNGALGKEITERWNAEKRLREANRATRLILDSISDKFFAFDKDWRYSYLNQQAAEQLSALGKNPASLIGKSLWNEFPVVYGEEGLRRAMQERAVVTQEHFYSPLGEWVENRIFPSSDGGLVMFQRYITERKLAEEALKKAHAELAHVDRVSTMGELAASIAHEVNQPLAAVVTNAQACLRWLAAEPVNGYEVHAAVERIIRDANRASAIISRIRAFLASTEAHKVPLHIKQVLQEVAILVQGEARAQGVSLRIGAAGDLPLVLADSVQLHQVILNLVMNAMDAMRSVPDALRVLVLGAEKCGVDAILVAVRDSGIGLDPAHRDRVFNAFYTTKPGGMGMGLAISRSIVEAHGGRIWVTANADGGETFQFTLPISQTES